jgi:Protein of unknown function (DUF2490)
LKLLLFILLLFFSIQLIAQRPVTGMWLTLHLPVQINNKWQIHNEGGYRTLGNNIDPLQYLYRPGIRYAIDKHFNTAAGVAFFYTRTTFSKQNEEFAKEFRFWEEVNYKTDLVKNLQWLTRLRIEQRSFAATSTKAAYHAFRYRVRTQLQQKLSNRWAILLADEYMQQHAFNKWQFDQNRLIANAVYYFNPATQLQAGYMWLRWPAHSSQNILTVSFQKTISVHGK